MGLNVLSLFDGISCGRVALERAGIEVDSYYASEIDPYAIAISRYNNREVKHIGNVCDLDEDFLKSLPNIDLIIGGSPCQDLSSSNVWTEKKGLEGAKSRLFYEYVRVLDSIKMNNNPNVYFLLENVGSASIKDREIIDKCLGVTGKKFNSKLLSAQNRNRIYWTNIDFDIPNERLPLYMKGLLEDRVEDKYYLTEKMYNCVISQR